MVSGAFGSRVSLCVVNHVENNGRWADFSAPPASSPFSSLMSINFVSKGFKHFWCHKNILILIVMIFEHHSSFLTNLHQLF